MRWKLQQLISAIEKAFHSPRQKAPDNPFWRRKGAGGNPWPKLFEAVDTPHQGFNRYPNAQYDLPKSPRQEASKNSARDPTCSLSDKHNPIPMNRANPKPADKLRCYFEIRQGLKAKSRKNEGKKAQEWQRDIFHP